LLFVCFEESVVFVFASLCLFVDAKYV